MGQGPGRRVIIIGGGASGVLMACHLLRESRNGFTVTLIERRADLGAGVAYSTPRPEHLLNVRAANMSAFSDDPDHFWRWISAQPDGRPLCPDPYCFVERRVYGRYMASLAASYAEAGGRLQIIRGECSSATEMPGSIAVTLQNGAVHVGDRAIFATGNDAYGWMPDEGYLSPWSDAAINALDPDQPVAVLGTGLTMVDYVLALVQHGHRGPIHAFSRRGLLPQVHRRVEAVALAKEDVPFGKPIGYFTRWLRRLVAVHEAEGRDWRSVIDGLRPFTQEIWWTFSTESKRRFLDHARVWWDAHRHRMAPEVSTRLQHILSTGQLRIQTAKVLGEARRPAGLAVRFRRRGCSQPEELLVQKVVDCRGIVTDPLASGNPVIRDLLQRGLARPDPLRIGIDVSMDGAILNGKGVPSQRLFAIGPLSRAAFWEIVAVPDIRAQCERLSRHLSVGAYSIRA